MGRTVLWLAMVAILAVGGGPAGARSKTAGPPSVGIVPFLDETGTKGAVAVATAEVERALRDAGFRTEGNGRTDAFLRERRIRARTAMSREDARALAERLGVRYLLFGTITMWQIDRGPQVGLTARMSDAETGTTVWAGSASLHAVEAPGLLTLGRPKTLEAAARKAVDEMFDTLRIQREGDLRVPGMRKKRPDRTLLAEKPIAFRSPSLKSRPHLRVAVFPFTNMTLNPEASAVIGERTLNWLLTIPDVEVVDPGDVRRVLIQENIQPLFGLDPGQLRTFRHVLDVDAVVDGTVLVFENGSSPTPRVDLYARLRDAQTGETLWAATTAREGDDTKTIYDLGRIQGVDKLADQAIGELLSTWRR